MQAPVIHQIGHVALRVRDLAAAEEFSTALVGLHVTARTDDALWLSHGTCHHTLQYIRADEDAFDHLGLIAPDAESVEIIRDRVGAAGLEILDDPAQRPAVDDGFFFRAEGFTFEIYTRMARVDPVVTTALRPSRLGHANFFVSEPARLQKVLKEILDFRVSDKAGPQGEFLRCNVDHHGIGVFPGDGVVHHYAWEYPTMFEVAKMADAIDARGGSTLWGPLRHGMGRNIATYVKEPSGMLVEFYADLERIYDAHHVPGEWDFEGDQKAVSLWARHDIVEEFMAAGLPPARLTAPITQRT
jgi:catechol-2,3-dioxygenase